MWKTVIAGVFPLVTAVILLVFTAGGLGKLGARAERLAELANKMPDGGPGQKDLRAAAEAEAGKLAKRVTDPTPRLLKAALVYVLFFYYFTLLVIFFAGNAESGGYYIGRRIGTYETMFHLSQNWAGFAVITDMVRNAFLFVAVLVIAYYALQWAWRRWAGPRLKSFAGRVWDKVRGKGPATVRDSRLDRGRQRSGGQRRGLTGRRGVPLASGGPSSRRRGARRHGRVAIGRSRRHAWPSPGHAPVEAAGRTSVRRLGVVAANNHPDSAATAGTRPGGRRSA